MASTCLPRSIRPAPPPRAIFAVSDDIATLNYTGGTTGKSKGTLRHHREYGGFATAILADFEIPDGARYLTVVPISHVAGTKVLPTLMRGGTVHMLKGFDPEAVLATIARKHINFTLFVPTMIYVLLDHPALGKTDLSSLELVLYGASAMSPTRLTEGIEHIGPVMRSAAHTTSAAGAEPCCIEGSQGPAASGLTATCAPSTRKIGGISSAPAGAARQPALAKVRSAPTGNSISTSSVETCFPRSIRTMTLSGSSTTWRETTARISSRSCINRSGWPRRPPRSCASRICSRSRAIGAVA
jgi:acyl-CoA synthetase (AMP-forming)/AMP-acid ligase II